MPVLSRRRSLDHRQECWLIYYGDIHAGTIERVGNPHDTEPWEWRCGFYPGSRPGECTSRTAATFDRPRADFEQACAGISIEADGGRFSGMGNIFSLR
jgi:hypothetical protein